MFHVKCCGSNIDGHVCVAQVYILPCIMLVSNIMPKVAVEGLFLYKQLGRMRYATVSEFKGRKMVHIREYYDADGEIRPGKKGQCAVLHIF